MTDVAPTDDAPEADPEADPETSVRPPDLEGPDVADRPHPLDGWDDDGDVADLPPTRAGLDPETTAAIAVGAAAMGALIGALVSRRRGRGAVLGALLAALTGLIASRTAGR